MRQDVTDQRPKRLYISTRLFWSLIILAVGLPIMGFAISAGVLAPAWLKMDFKSMQKSVEKAERKLEPLQQQNATLSANHEKLTEQLEQERKRRAEAEARVTMAETARVEAAGRLGQLEGELVDLKRSVATYERLLKPKLQRELVECVSQDVTYANNQVSYNLGFTKVSRNVSVPENLTVQVRVQSGNNAVALEQSVAAGGASTTHALDLSKSQHVRGSFAIALPDDATRVLDIKVLDGNTPVGYCWKSF